LLHHGKSHGVSVISVIGVAPVVGSRAEVALTDRPISYDAQANSIVESVTLDVACQEALTIAGSCVRALGGADHRGHRRIGPGIGIARVPARISDGIPALLRVAASFRQAPPRGVTAQVVILPTFRESRLLPVYGGPSTKTRPIRTRAAGQLPATRTARWSLPLSRRAGPGPHPDAAPPRAKCALPGTVLIVSQGGERQPGRWI
jgi:hypothetical protein